jgi:hypothetical protein
MKTISSQIVQTAAALTVCLLLTFQSHGCKDQGVDQPILVSPNHTDVILKNTDTFRYPTVGGDEEGARISLQARHYNVSEIQRNADTHWIAVYVYQPKTGYVGTDYVEIEIQSSPDGTILPTNLRTVAFRFVITN